MRTFCPGDVGPRLVCTCDELNDSLRGGFTFCVVPEDI